MPSGDLGQQHEAALDSHRSYILRLWKEKPDAPWRGELRDVTTGEEHRFSELDSIIAFLREEDAWRRGKEFTRDRDVAGPEAETKMDGEAYTGPDQ